MQLEWKHHPSQILNGISEIFQNCQLCDVTLTAEGKKIRAHRLILSAASTYFKDVLTSEDFEKSPIIFLKDVAFTELESLIQFIYFGKTTISGTDVESFLKLVKTLGVKGFSFEENKNETADSVLKEIGNTVAAPPFKKSSASEPVSMPSYLLDKQSDELSEGGSQKKRRKLQSKSLDEIIISPPTTFKTPQHLRTPTTPLSPLILPSFWTAAPVSASTLCSAAGPSSSQSHVTSSNPAAPPRQTFTHTSHLSCPVESVPSPKSISRQANATNFSFDGGADFLDPNELAAKGATLLHHLALWMIEEKRSKELQEEQDTSRVRHESIPTAQPTTGNILHRHRGSECDRPDSGFDSKDEDESKNLNVTLPSQQQRHMSETISEENLSSVARTASDASSSPDTLTEISRQAPIRQPVFRKRRIQMH